MRVVRDAEELPGALETARQRGAQGLRRRQRVPREVHRAPAPRRDPDPRRRRRARSTWASASARSSGGTRSWSRRRPRSRSTPSCGSGWARRPWPRREAVGLPRRRHLRVPARRRPLLLLPRDEHADPGRAPGHRAGLRRGPGAGAAPHRGGPADAGARRLAPAARLGDRVPHHQRGSGQRLSPVAPAASSTSACPAGPGVRWDSGVEVGDEVTLHYDSMLAKLIVWAPDRAQAIDAHARARSTSWPCSGVATNQGFHRRLMADPAFREGDIDIQFLERRADLLAAGAVGDGRVAARGRRRAGRGRRRGASPAAGGRGDDGGGHAWQRQARLEGMR